MNQIHLQTLQELVMRIEMLRTYEPKNIENILDVLRSSPQLQTPKTKLILSHSLTKKNWINLKYNIIDDMVLKMGDFTD
ncbi:hypothetical protein ASF92_14190 [Pedobacter sp. Leaf176]|nr:hypothetical protein ASF92_14190 [Pedobacter sp. Leaf176]